MSRGFHANRLVGWEVCEAPGWKIVSVPLPFLALWEAPLNTASRRWEEQLLSADVSQVSVSLEDL